MEGDRNHCTAGLVVSEEEHNFQEDEGGVAGTYSETLEIAILIVKRDEKASRTTFSLVPKRVGLIYPFNMSP